MTEAGKRSKKGLLIGGAVVLAAVVGVVGFVLPAEYGIDPTGIGKATGVPPIASICEACAADGERRIMPWTSSRLRIGLSRV